LLDPIPAWSQTAAGLPSLRGVPEAFQRFLGNRGRNSENMAPMGATPHSLWSLAPAAARATWIDTVSKRPLWIVAFAFICIVVAPRAGRAPRNERWAEIRAKWAYELRDACLVVLWTGLLVFGCELHWTQRNEVRQRLLQNPNYSNDLSGLSWHAPVGPSAAGWGSRFNCVQVHLPKGFSGGGYALPFKPAGPSPPVLFNNGKAQRKDVDYTVSGGRIVVNFKPASQDSLSVWYTTSDLFSIFLP
jgi:hypothetical protein